MTAVRGRSRPPATERRTARRPLARSRLARRNRLPASALSGSAEASPKRRAGRGGAPRTQQTERAAAGSPTRASADGRPGNNSLAPRLLGPFAVASADGRLHLSLLALAVALLLLSLLGLPGNERLLRLLPAHARALAFEVQTFVALAAGGLAVGIVAVLTFLALRG